MITSEEIDKLKAGVEIENNGEIYLTKPAKAKILKTDELKQISRVQITIHEGKNRQVRRMFEALGYEVIKLKRESIEDLTLEGLKKGEYRPLTIHEVKRLINKAKNGEK